MAASSPKVEDIQKAISSAAAKMKYLQLRPDQEKVVKEFMSGKDVFVSLPTGSGKSLCYCLLPLAFNYLKCGSMSLEVSSIVVVVSPLVALMKDQVRAMQERSVSAIYAGDMDKEAEEAVCLGQYQLIFISPESLLSSDFWHDALMSPVYQDNLVGLVIDEAHCVKKWGTTFRKSYLELGSVRSLVPNTVKIMALTATATRATRNTVCKILGMASPCVIAKVPNKPNIKYFVRTEPKCFNKVFSSLAEEIRRKRTDMDRVIVYCRNYDSCTMIYLFLKYLLKGEMTDPVGTRDLAVFRLVDMFTACTRPAVKESILKSFCEPHSILRVVIATVAFGMGVDCPNVRRVIHWGPSSDIEQYLQETGRAGRDGLSSVAVLYTVDLEHSDETMKEYYKNKVVCRRHLLLKQFTESVDSSTTCEPLCQCCDICELVCMCPSCSNSVL